MHEDSDDEDADDDDDGEEEDQDDDDDDDDEGDDDEYDEEGCRSSSGDEDATFSDGRPCALPADVGSPPKLHRADLRRASSVLWHSVGPKNVPLWRRSEWIVLAGVVGAVIAGVLKWRFR